MDSFPTSSRVILVEAYRAHGECLDFQVAALQRAGMQVEVWTTRESRWRPSNANTTQRILAPPFCLRAAALLWCARPACLIINTATGPVVRDMLCLIKPLGIPTVGIFHDVAKLRVQFSSRLIARLVHSRLALAEHLAVEASNATALPFAHTHLLGGGMPSSHAGSREVIEFAIPGTFSSDKKDAEFLSALLEDPLLDPRIRFTLLGRYPQDPQGSAWWQHCVRMGVAHRMTRFDNYVPKSVFDEHLARSVGILPLIHPGCDHYQRFCTDKISGSVNLALGMRIPLLLHRELSQHWHFGPVITSYRSSSELRMMLNDLVDHTHWQHRRSLIAASPQCQTSYQQALYLRACVQAARMTHQPSDHRQIPTPSATTSRSIKPATTAILAGESRFGVKALSG